MRNSEREQPKLDTSVKKLAVLPGGETAFITGKGLAVEGTLQEIDVTDIDPADEEHLRANLQDVQVSQVGDKITLKPRTGRAVTVKAKRKEQ